MPGLDLTGIPLTALVAIFVAAGAGVWLAGARLSGYAEAISERTGVGEAFLGALLLGGITSLPELATTLSAAFAGDADMAVNNIFGGIAMQVAILAVADAVVRTGPLSASLREPVIMLQGVLLILIVALAMAGMIVGEPETLPVGPWAIAVGIAALASFYVMKRSEGHAAWQPVTREGRLERSEVGTAHSVSPEEEEHPGDGAAARRSLEAMIGLSAFAGLVILAAGVVLTQSGEALATRTGLGSSFVGAALVATSTSLPELSTTIAAVRLGRYDMAFSNVFGANLIDVGLIAITDAAYDGPPVLGEMGTFAIFAALLAIVVTGVFLVGLIWRRVGRVRRVGIDSIVVIVLYLAGLYTLFTIR